MDVATAPDARLGDTTSSEWSAFMLIEGSIDPILSELPRAYALLIAHPEMTATSEKIEAHTPRKSQWQSGPLTSSPIRRGCCSLAR